METKYKDDYLEVKTDDDKSIVYWYWTPLSKDLSQEDFLHRAQKILEIILSNRYKYGIGDARDFKYPITPDLQEKMNAEMLTKLSGVTKKMAHVYPTDIISQMGTEQLWDENINKSYEDKFFDTLEDAQKWIDS